MLCVNKLEGSFDSIIAFSYGLLYNADWTCGLNYVALQRI